MTTWTLNSFEKPEKPAITFGQFGQKFPSVLSLPDPLARAAFIQYLESYGLAVFNKDDVTRITVADALLIGIDHNTEPDWEYAYWYGDRVVFEGNLAGIIPDMPTKTPVVMLETVLNWVEFHEHRIADQKREAAELKARAEKEKPSA